MECPHCHGKLQVTIEVLELPVPVKGPVIGPAWEQRLHGRVTPRDIDIIRLAFDGMSQKEIADKMDVSTDTIKSRMARSYKRLKVHNFAGLVNFCFGPR